MRRLVRITVLVVGLLSILASMAGPASAGFTNRGDTSFSATTGPVTITGGSATLTCSSGSMDGVAGTSFPAGVWLNAEAGHITTAGCRIAGAPARLTCGWSYDVQTISGGVVAGQLNANSAFGPQYGCTVSGTTCRLDGSISGTTYTNPVVPFTFGRMAVPGSSSLVISGGGCVLGAGTASMTALGFTVVWGAGGPTPHLGPKYSSP